VSNADRDRCNARYLESCPDADLEPSKGSRPPAMELRRGTRLRSYAREEPSAFLLSLDDQLPRSGRALDVAGGAGRNAVWLARRGLAVTLVDISSEALTLARGHASRAGVTLDLRELDLEREPLPPGPFDLILCFNFLRRELFPRFREHLGPDGWLVYLQPTRSNLLRHPRPPAAFLLEDGELPAQLSGLEILSYEEGWFGQEEEEPRHEARLVARLPRGGPAGSREA
jgi:tellurite methyltransferase